MRIPLHVFIAIIVVVLTGCGDSTFSGATASKESADSTAAPSEPPTVEAPAPVTPPEMEIMFDEKDQTQVMEPVPVNETIPEVETETDLADNTPDKCDNPCGGGFECAEDLRNATPIAISTREQLALLESNRHYVLMNDLPDVEVSGRHVVNVIFDGNGHTLTGVDNGQTGHAGDNLGAVMGWGSNVYIKNVKVESLRVHTARNNIGGIVGRIGGKSCIENVSVRNSNIRGYSVGGLGGIVGAVNSAGLTMKNATVTNTRIDLYRLQGSAGGLIGDFTLGELPTTITDCRVSGVHLTGTEGGYHGGTFGHIGSPIARNVAPTLVSGCDVETTHELDATGNAFSVYGGLIGVTTLGYTKDTTYTDTIITFADTTVRAEHLNPENDSFLGEHVGHEDHGTINFPAEPFSFDGVDSDFLPSI